MEPAYDTVPLVSHWVLIKVTDRATNKLVVFLHWKGLPWEVFRKWGWYFRYRAALAQVQHPRCEVVHSWGNTPLDNQEGRELTNKIRAKKAKITQFESSINRARQDWKQLFPIEDDILYKRATAKVERLKQELTDLLNQAA